MREIVCKYNGLIISMLSVFSFYLETLGKVFHAPRVKSGISTGRLPFSTDCSLSSVMHDHSAAS